MIPNLLKKKPIPDNIPKELDNKIEELKKDSSSKNDFLKKCFLFVANRWKGNRFNIIFRFNDLFINDIAIIMNKKGYTHCTHMNYVLRIMLVKSGLFDDKDIKIKLTNTWFIAPHQYLEVKIDKSKEMQVDPYYYQYGIDYGDYGTGFRSMKIRPIR